MKSILKLMIIVSLIAFAFNNLAGEEKVKDKAKVKMLIFKPDPAVLKILKNLKENEGVYLPALKTAGNINAEQKKFKLDKFGPRPRDYCLKWVWAPERKRALFCGANAGTPHRLNDVWEYDLGSNTWVCLWSPDPDMNKYRRLKKGDEKKKIVEATGYVKDNVSFTNRGAPFDPIHTWWALTYDPNAKALFWVMGHQNKTGYLKKMDRSIMNLWAYYPEKNSWAFMRTSPSPRVANASILDYIPEWKGLLWYSYKSKSMDMYDSKDNTWTKLMKVPQNTDFPGPEAVSAYDTGNKILVVHRGGGTHKGKPVPKITYHYDIMNKKWTKVIESAEGPRGKDNKAPMVYDSNAKVCLIIDNKEIWSYKVGDKKWIKRIPTGTPNISKRAFMGCYNPEYNVIMADNGSGKVWVYRAKNKTTIQKQQKRKQ